jgi:hypothetical protein
MWLELQNSPSNLKAARTYGIAAKVRTKKRIKPQPHFCVRPRHFNVPHRLTLAEINPTAVLLKGRNRLDFSN